MPVDGAVRAVVAVAGRQHGVMSVGQLERAGLGRHAVAHGAQAGWLRPLHRGVYLVGPLETEHSRAMVLSDLLCEVGVTDAALVGPRKAPRVQAEIHV